jgi:hypothetical protein
MYYAVDSSLVPMIWLFTEVAGCGHSLVTRGDNGKTN